MPASLLGELIVAPVLEIVFHVVGYQVGRITVTVLTLGAWGCDPFLSDSPPQGARGSGMYCLVPMQRKFVQRSLDGPRLGGLYRRRSGRVFLPAEVTALIGVVVSIAVAVGVGYLSSPAKDRDSVAKKPLAQDSVTNRAAITSQP